MRLIVKAVDRAEIGNLEKAGLDEQQIVSTQATSKELDLSHVNYRLAPVDPCGPEWFISAHPCKPGQLHLEENNIFRGFGWYRTICTLEKNVQGFLVRSGSDVLSLYLGAHFLGTLVPGGGDAYVSLPENIHFSVDSELVVRAEIWGHANFDDHRLPVLRLKSMRGMDGMVAVRENENITSNWFYQHRVQIPAPQIDPVWPYINFGGWSATEEPLRGVYYREVSFANGMDVCVLHFPGLQVNAQVFLNGQSAGVVNPFNPFVDLSDLSQPGETAVIAVAVEQDFRRSAGQVLLYQGESLQEWELAGWDESGLAGLANESALAAKDVNFPVTLAGGEMAWLHVDLPLSVDWDRGWDLQLEGHGLKVSAWIGKRLVGRIWLPSKMRPRMTGGAEDHMVLPVDWLQDANGQLHLLLEGVSSVGELSKLKFILDM
jgi:beta-galactosidase